MMLETTATRLWSEPGAPHFGCPGQGARGPAAGARGRRPAVGPVHHRDPRRHRRDAARAGRVAARDPHVGARRYGHVQEVIVQNFRAKPDTAMRHDRRPRRSRSTSPRSPSPGCCSARGSRVQAPPNLSDPAELALLLRAGVDDWGGVSPLTPDHVNPERPWPHVDDLARLHRRGRLRAARAAHRPPGVRPARRAVARPAGAPARAALADPARARPPRGRVPAGLPWQEPTTSGVRRLRRRRHRAAPTCTRASTPTAAPATGAATSTRSTATGPSSVRRRRAASDRGARRAARRATCARRCARRRRPGGAGRRTHADLALALMPRRRRRRSTRSPRIADDAAPRRRRRRRHLRRQPEHQLHQRLLHRLPVLRLRAAPHRRRRLHAVARPGRRPRRGGVGASARPRSACRAASTPTCPAPRTSTSSAR